MLGSLGLFAEPKENGAKRFGDLGDKKNVNEQLEDLKGKVSKTIGKSKSEIQNYRELAKFNEHLTKSYASNLNIMVEVSQLLSSYNEVFDLFKVKLAEIDKELGIPISGDDFEHMKKLTTEQMIQLNDVFKKETNNLKGLYARYGKQKEYDEVENAEKLFDETKKSGEEVYAKLRNQGISGGKKPQPKKKTNKKKVKK